MPVLSISLDGFDTPVAGCTTHLASMVLLDTVVRGEAHSPDYPWLVRLNPGIPWKTRGNGAVVLHFSVDCKAEANKIIERVKRLLKDYARSLKVPPSKPCAVALLRQNLKEAPPQLRTLYKKALTSMVSSELAAELLKASGAIPLMECGRGIVGALAALGADFSQDHTFELLTYRSPEQWMKKRQVSESSVIEFDLATRPYTFLNYDFEERKVLIAPHGTDPILYGVRGEEPHVVLKALDVIEAGEKPTHWILVRTNQATGAHYVYRSAESLRPYDTAVVEGVVESVTCIPGPHLIVKLKVGIRTLYVMIYRETGRMLRKARRLVKPGLHLRVGGVCKLHGELFGINAEFVEVIEGYVVRESRGLRCPLCGAHLERCGNTIACPECSFKVYRTPLVEAREVQTTVILPSESAFHHLMVPPRRLPFMTMSKRIEPPSTPVAGLI